MTSETEQKIGSIKTYTLVAWIFSILTVVAWVILFLYFFVAMFIFGLLGAFYYYGAVAAVGFIYGIILLVFMIPSIIVMRRSGRLYKAAGRGDIQALKANNSLGWAVVALIFTGVIPGIMLLIAHGPINDLKMTAASRGSILETDALDKLERLKSLLDSGVINKEEFDAQKKRIMGPISQYVNTPEDELKKLKQLLDSGAITKTEYEEQKKRVLSKI